MSPYPAQVNRARIIATARTMIERDGVDQLALGKLATALGIKAPSLYRHIASKDALLRAVNTQTVIELSQRLSAACAGPGADPTERLVNAARVYREYARAHPALYGLLFGPFAESIMPDEKLRRGVVEPLQRLVTAIAGEARALPALRGLWALLHGYTSLELAGQFRRGGDLEATWEQVLRVYLASWRG